MNDVDEPTLTVASAVTLVALVDAGSLAISNRNDASHVHSSTAQLLVAAGLARCGLRVDTIGRRVILVDTIEPSEHGRQVAERLRSVRAVREVT